MLRRGGWRGRGLRVGSLGLQAKEMYTLAIIFAAMVSIGGEWEETYDNGTLAPTAIPMPTNEAQPITLAPDARPHRDLWVQLHAHLEVTLQLRHRNRKRMAHLCTTLEASIDHGVEIALLGCFGRRGLGRSAVDGFVKDWVVGVMLLHSAQIVGAFEEVLALARGVFGAHGLAVDALRRQTLWVVAACISILRCRIGGRGCCM